MKSFFKNWTQAMVSLITEMGEALTNRDESSFK
jgi:hypothetical protein